MVVPTSSRRRWPDTTAVSRPSFSRTKMTGSSLWATSLGGRFEPVRGRCSCTQPAALRLLIHDGPGRAVIRQVPPLAPRAHEPAQRVVHLAGGVRARSCVFPREAKVWRDERPFLVVDRARVRIALRRGATAHGELPVGRSPKTNRAQSSKQPLDTAARGNGRRIQVEGADYGMASQQYPDSDNGGGPGVSRSQTRRRRLHR